MKESETAGGLLQLNEVACLRGGRLLFERLSLSLGPGDAAVATGPNGAGKSSLLRIVAGLLGPSAGTVRRPSRIAFDGEAAALDRDAPLGRALGFWAGLDGADGVRRDAALDAMDLRDLAPVPVGMLSTGQRRRASLARVVASGARLWLLDEPANGLDAASLDRLAQAMAVHRAGGGAILAASHVPIGLEAPRAVAL